MVVVFRVWVVYSDACDCVQFTGVFIDSQPGLISNFCTPQGAPYLKAGKRSTTTLGIFWQRRVCKGRVRCELGGASSFQEDEIGPDANVPSTSDGNDTVSHLP